MTQTASISSINKNNFLKKILKGFGTGSSRFAAEEKTPPMPAPEGLNNKEAGS